MAFMAKRRNRGWEGRPIYILYMVLMHAEPRLLYEGVATRVTEELRGEYLYEWLVLPSLSTMNVL